MAVCLFSDDPARNDATGEIDGQTRSMANDAAVRMAQTVCTRKSSKPRNKAITKAANSKRFGGIYTSSSIRLVIEQDRAATQGPPSAQTQSHTIPSAIRAAPLDDLGRCAVFQYRPGGCRFLEQEVS